MSFRQIEVGVCILLLAVLAVAWIIRRVQSLRVSVASRNDVAFERQYEPVEPESSQHRGLETTARVITRLHQGWMLLSVPFLLAAAVVAFRSNRLVRLIIAATVATMLIIVAVWALGRRLLGTTDVAGSQSGGSTDRE